MTKKNKQIIVFGGTGFYGQKVVKKLLQKNQIVKVVTRNAENSKRLFGNEVEVFQGDVTEKGVIKESLKNVSAIVICLSAMSNKLIRKMKEIERDAVLEIMEEAKKANISRLVYMSGYEMRKQLLDDLKIPEFGEIKIEVEEKIRQSDFNWTTPEARKLFNADYVVWLDTISKGRYEDTNKMFVQPKKFDFRVTTQDAELWALQISDKIIEYKWDNKKPTAQMLGRWQPFHNGHYALFEEIIKKTGQVCIQVRDVHGVGDNPFDFETVKSIITQRLESNFKNRFKVILVPNISNICYGRGVGYKIEEIVLSEEIQKISATKIRKEMREKAKKK